MGILGAHLHGSSTTLWKTDDCACVVLILNGVDKEAQIWVTTFIVLRLICCEKTRDGLWLMHNPSCNLRYRSFHELAPYRERLQKKGIRFKAEQYLGGGAGASVARCDDAQAE
jgi:hypothetical protein